MTVLSMQRTVSGVLTSATEARLTVTNSAGSEVVSDVVVLPLSAGVYTYDTGYITPGQYTATWTFEVTDQPDTIVSRVFEADAAVSLVKGVTLMEIEQRLARCIGRYYRYKAGDTSTVEQLYIRRIKSSIDSGDYENLFILRRGILWDGSLIEDFVADDRYRQVDTYTAATGLLTPDEPWDVAPMQNEAIELHYFDPEQELRPVVLDGLRRCYFWDRLSLTSTGVDNVVNLATSFPFMDGPTIISNASLSLPGSRLPATDLSWFNTYSSADGVYLNTEWVGTGNIELDVLRRHSSYVNGELSLSGPNSDTDILIVDIEYAVLAAWVEAWVQLTDRMTAAAAQGNRLTSEMVGAAFTKRSLGVYNQRPERSMIRFGSPVALTQVGNSMEVD